MRNNQLNLGKKEENLIKLIGRCGFFVDDFKSKLGVSKHVVASCLKKDLIYKENAMFFYSKIMIPYCLTNTGKSYVKDKYFISPYRFKPSQTNHDFVLSNIYLSLSEEEREEWISETSLMSLYPNEKVTDGMYRNKNGDVIGVEVITSSYSDFYIESKMSFIERYCDRSIIIDSDKY